MASSAIAVTWTCPSCGATTSAPESWGGSFIRCPNCTHCTPGSLPRAPIGRGRGKWGRPTIWEIAKRDGWSCHLCLTDIDPDSRDDLRATLDRVTPGSQGGGYGRRNVRLAHELCNQLRGDRPVEEIQPRLVKLATLRAERAEQTPTASSATAR